MTPLGAPQKGGALLVVEGVPAGLLQEEFLCLFAQQRMHIPFLHPSRDFHLCVLPPFAAPATVAPSASATAAAASGDQDSAAAAAAIEVAAEECINLFPGSSMTELMRAARQPGGMLYLFPRAPKETAGKQETVKKAEALSQCRVLAFPETLSLEDNVISVCSPGQRSILLRRHLFMCYAHQQTTSVFGVIYPGSYCISVRMHASM